MILAIIIFLVGAAYYWIKKFEINLKPLEIESYTIENLCFEVKQRLHDVVNENPDDLNLNKLETEKRKKIQSRLSYSLKACASGDLGAKSYVKDYIYKILEKGIGINEFTINQGILFDAPQKLTSQDKFDILLNYYKNRHGFSGLERMLVENHLDELRNNCYEVTDEDIQYLFEKEQICLTYIDKLDILCQRIYSLLYGNSAVDEIMDMKLDGISAGVSGMTEEMFDYAEMFVVSVENQTEESSVEEENQKKLYSFNSIWINLQGKQIHLSCIGFGNRQELIRVCKNVYRVNNPGQLTQDKGYIITDRKDGSRAVVVRPDFSDSWAFLVRKHRIGDFTKMEDVITGTNAYIPIKVLEYMVKGNMVFAITGGQNCGKTTLLRSTIGYIRKTYNIRIQEMIFELFLRKSFPMSNIITFRELPNVSGEEALELSRKMDGSVTILGEVVSYLVGRWIITMSQVGSLMTMFTHHAKTTAALLRWFRTALLLSGGFSSERAAMEEIVNSLNADVHCSQMEHIRYLEHITEIVPLQNQKKLYELKKLVEFDEEKKEYRLLCGFSEPMKKQILHYLTKEEKQEFYEFFKCVE